MHGRNAWWQDVPVVIAMHHDHSANHPCAHSPAGGPAKFLLSIAGLDLDPSRAGEILSEKMRGPGLDRFPVLHHRFDAKGLHRARKPFAFRFLADENWHGEIVTIESVI